MAERLRKVAQELAGIGMDLFRQQSERVRAVAEGLVQRIGLIDPALTGQVVDEPEAAQQEVSLGSGPLLTSCRNT